MIGRINRRMASRRIPQLEGLRLVMCCVIIFSHFEFLSEAGTFGKIYNTYLHNPTLAVDFFFMLSGFGLFLSPTRPNCSFRGGISFALSKIKKMYPAYLVSLLLGVPITLFGFLGDCSLAKSIVKVTLFFGIDLSLMQSITGLRMFSNSINGVCWFLSTLAICYFGCPFLLKFFDKINSKKSCVFLLLIFVFVVFGFSRIAQLIESKSIFDDLWYGSPYIRYWYLAIGMCVAFLYKQTKKKFGTTNELLIVIVSIIYSVLRNSMDIEICYLRVIDVLLCTIFLYVFASGDGLLTKILSESVFIKLSKFTMLLYLFHYPVRKTVTFIFTSVFADYQSSNFYYFGEIVLILSITIVLVMLFTKLEKRKKI